MKLSLKILAKDCKFEHACLDCNGHKICEVKECLNNKILFVDYNQSMCDYYISFGNEKVCFCPTRKEIFQKYYM